MARTGESSRSSSMPSAQRSFAIANLAGNISRERLALYALAALSAAALALAGVFLPENTSLAPHCYIVAAFCWLSGSLLSVGYERWRGVASNAPWCNPLMLFFAIVAATYTIHAMDGIPETPTAFDPTRPDELPGLYTNFTSYYLVLLAAVVLFISWYGRDRDRELETGIALIVVFTSVAFEHMLRGAGTEVKPAVGTLSTPFLWAPLLVLFAMWQLDAARSSRTWHWTALGGPLLALLAAGLLSTTFSYYVHASLLMWLRLAAFVALLLLVANTVSSARQVRLYWLALLAPLAGAAIAVLVKLWDINWHLGPGFVLSLRYQVSGVAGTNPAGLSLGIGILLVIGAMIVERRWRWFLAPLLVPLAPAFLSTHSPSGLVALIVACIGLVVFRYGYDTYRAGPRRWGWVAGAAALLVLVLGLIAVVPNPYTGKVSGDVQDPTTGRSVRGLVWRLAFENIRDNPLTGVGMQNYYVRTKHVDDFPSVDATQIAERRVLLEGTGEPWKLYVTSHPHNAYLAVVETMGLPGLAALMWLAIALWGIAWRLFRRADGTFLWWASTLSLAGAGMALAWNVVAQGEDVAIIALPFFPFAGLALGSLPLLQPDAANQRSPAWAWLTKPFEAWWQSPNRSPVLAAVVTLAFLAAVARPVAAELLAAESDDTVSVDNARSLRMIQWATRLSPMSADYHTRLSNAWLRTPNGYERGLGEQLAALDARRDFAPDEARLGWLYWYGRELDEAEAAFQRAVALDRWDTTRGDVHMALGLAQAARGDRDASLSTFAYGFSVSSSMLQDEAWVRDDGVSPPLTYLDPAYLLRVGQRLPIPLLRVLVRRLELPGRPPPIGDPGDAVSYNLSAILERMHADYESLLATDSDRAYALLNTIGEIALNAGLPDDALGFYQELAAAQPESDKAFYGLGLAYSALDQDREAAAAFQTVLEISDNDGGLVVREPFSHFQLGRIALEEQPPDIQAARRELAVARETYRWSYLPHLYPYLAIADALSGDKDGAQQALDRELYLLDK
jgi:O-antigen ligase/tetratricopeptide (TPR) repeat protein